MIAGAEPPGPADAPNNFDALRLLFAAAVIIFHLAALTALPALAPMRDALGAAANIGVKGFFVISGYLVYGSWERTRSLARYAEKRARRLYPAYATVVIAMALISLALFARGGADLAHAARYLGANLVFANFLAPTLPGLFPENPFSEVNGALWTIKVEVGFYLIVPVLFFLMMRAPKAAVVALIYAGAILWRLAFEGTAARADWPWGDELARQLPGQMSYFIGGVALWTWRGAARRHVRRVGAVGAALLALSVLPPLTAALQPAGLAGAIFFAAYGLPRIYDARRHGDYSYGLYLVHFPVMQLVVLAGLFAAAPMLATALTLALIAAAMLAMWRFVERPFLLASSHYKTV